MTTKTTFRNEESNELFYSNQLNHIPVGVYQSTDIYWLNLIITNDRVIVLSSFDHVIDEDMLNEEFEELECPIIHPEYISCNRSGDDWIRSKGY